jgi:hypothetical protein
MMQELSQRGQLANFLTRLVTIGVSAEDWQQYLVTHYPDLIMENARTSVVRLTLSHELDRRELSNSSLQLYITDSELCIQIQAIADTLSSRADSSCSC